MFIGGFIITYVLVLWLGLFDIQSKSHSKKLQQLILLPFVCL